MCHRHSCLWFVVALLLATPLAAHVGDVNTFFEGNAGPYPIRVVVRPPGVVPGRAEITIRTNAPDVTRVTVKPMKWDDVAAPPPDVAEPVRGQRGLYTAQLWLMSSGSYSIDVNIDGARGSGRAVVPVTNIAVKRLPMPRALGIVLFLCGLILVAGAVSIVGAGVREAIGTNASSQRRARLSMLIAAVLFIVLVARGNAWWNSVDTAYRQRLFRPFAVKTSVANGVLTLDITDERWRNQREVRWSELMPDHGKLMHLFLIAENQGALAHLHPVSVSRERFRVNVPQLAPGRYRLFADITHESGFTQTLVDTITIGPQPAMPPTDPDDSSFSPSHPSAATITFRETPLVAGRDVDLRFDVRDANGQPITPEPYMGMAGHAAIAAADFSVFVHVHPNGTISMASQQKFLARDGKVDHSAHAMHAQGSEVAFPYAFPKPGQYHIWVQTKVGGEVITRKFDVRVS